MVVILNNTTGSDITYTSVALTVTANSNATLAPAQVIICQDPNLKRDVLNGNITVGDSVVTYVAGDAIDYLNYVASTQIAANGFAKSFRHLTGNGTTTIKSTSGFFHALVVGNNTTGGTCTIYDNTAGSGTIILNLQFGTPAGGLLSSVGFVSPQMLGPLGLKFSTGLTVVLAGSTSNDITVIYL